MTSEHDHHRIQALDGTNYSTWSDEMKAYLRSKGLWHLVDGKELHSTTDTTEQSTWNAKQDKAAGEIMLHIAPD